MIIQTGCYSTHFTEHYKDTWGIDNLMIVSFSELNKLEISGKIFLRGYH